MKEISPLHHAVEVSDFQALVELLKSGGDVNEEQAGLSLLHRAIDVEIDSHDQSETPLHVDATAILLAFGADPKRKATNFRGESAEELALRRGHWLAVELIRQWIKTYNL
jgi:ankyrin repeat protein